MEELVRSATTFVTEYGAWAGPVIGILAFGESLAVVGLLIPATALMIAVGGLIGSGVIDPLPVIACGVAGAVLGDWVSYALGRSIGPSIYRRWPLNRHRTSVARARLFFRHYGFMSIFVGRFLGPLRSTIPLVAGVMDMQHRRFQLANVTSALLWVPLMFAPGYFAAKSLGSVEQITEAHLLGIGLLVAVVTLGATYLGSRILGRVEGSTRRPSTRALRSS